MTIIDTPGFGDDLENEARTIDELVNVLKNEVKFVHGFVIAFNGQSPRMTFRSAKKKRQHSRKCNALSSNLNLFYSA